MDTSMHHPPFDRRKYAREYARKQRAKKLAQRNASATTCQARMGRFGVCGGVLDTITDGQGRTAIVCPLCERRRRGICRDCGLPVAGTVGKALRCTYHTKAEKIRSQRVYKARNADDVRRRARDAVRSLDPVTRAERNARKKVWRKAHPEKVRAYRRRYALKHGAEQDSRYLDYHRRYNAQTARQQRKRADARRRYYELHPERPAPVCACGAAIPFSGSGRPRSTCNACCPPSERRRREKVASRALEREALRASETAATRPTLRVRRPMPARYAESGERLCVTPGCDIVVTGRKKKCTKCRERERVAAIAAMSAHQSGKERVA